MAILVGVVVSNMGYPILDPIIGLVIGLLIIKTAYGIAKENIDNIMGKVPSPELIYKIREVANQTPYAQNAHNIKVNYLGSYATAYLHIELDGNMSLDESHKIVHTVENNILENIPEIKSVMVHACPPGPGFEPGWSYDHRISSPTPYQAGPSRHMKNSIIKYMLKLINKVNVFI